MAKMIVILWRDIPAQVMVRAGRRNSIKMELPPRFAEAIDRAALRAGRGSSDAYLDDWRRVTEEFDGDFEARVADKVAALESEFDDEFLEAVVKAGGLIEVAKERLKGNSE